MTHSLSYLRRPFILICLLAGLTGCMPAYVNTESFGPKATAAELRDHYAGNSIRYALTRGGPVNVEAYFAPDGTHKLIFLDGTPIFSTGKWIASEKMLRIEATRYLVERDGSSQSRKTTEAYLIYIQPDGTVNADLLGGGNFDQPKPTPGFQAQERYDTLRRIAGF